MDTAELLAKCQGNSTGTCPLETLFVLHQDRRAFLQAKVLGSSPGMSCKVRVGDEASICPHSPRDLHTRRCSTDRGLFAARREEALKESHSRP